MTMVVDKLNNKHTKLAVESYYQKKCLVSLKFFDPPTAE